MSTRFSMSVETVKRYASSVWKGSEGNKGLPGRAYQKLSSIKTSIYILGLMALFFMIGTVFPQGESFEEYEKAGGKFIFFVSALDLLEFFSSPLFIILAIVFAMNLIICVLERYKALFARRTFPKSFEPTKSFLLTHERNQSHEDVRKALNDLKFRVVDKDSEWIVMEKGLPYRWLTWAYHAGIVICLFGILLTFLFAFEETMTLKPDEPQTIVPESTGLVQSIWQDKTPPTSFHLLLDKFTTEYIEAPELVYPEDRRARAAIGLGWQGLSHELKDDSLFPKDWWAKVKVVTGSATLAEKEMEINDPLEYGGYTIYLLGYEQEMKLMIDGNPLLIDAKADSEIMLPGTSSTLAFGTLRTGTATRVDGRKEELTPFVTVRKKGSTGDPAVLRMGDSIIVDNATVQLAGFTESAILSYRYDPGVSVLWVGGLTVLFAVALRFYGAYYLVAYKVDDTDAIVCLSVHITTKGLSANGQRLMNRLENRLTANDIKPIPLPPSA
jgi:cytochrome c biogenesis protein ResB